MVINVNKIEGNLLEYCLMNNSELNLTNEEWDYVIQ